MYEERNQYQITRKDARGCFVESLSDAFPIGKAHFAFATYDISRPAGQRQTNNIHIYIDLDEILELCRKLECGELRYLLQTKKKNNDKAGRPRKDGKSLSRTAQLLVGSKSDFLFVADSGPGETNEKGLIVPKFGNHPENHVAISMTFEVFSEFLLMTRIHYQAWLTVTYISKTGKQEQNTPNSFMPESKYAESDKLVEAMF